MNSAYSVLFMGHVDAGKSTLAGQILIALNMVPDEILNQYKELAKENKKFSWFISYLLDTDDFERRRGKTVEHNKIEIKIPIINKGMIEERRVYLIDAPGHRNYVAEMVNAAVTADVALLVLSAASSEFESGFEKDGQTREHLFLSRFMNIKKLIIAINKVDLIEDRERLELIKKKILKFAGGIYEKKNITFIEISAQQNINIVDEKIKMLLEKRENNKLDISEEIEGLTIKEESLISLFSRLEIDRTDDFLATVLTPHKNNSDIYINSGNCDLSEDIYYINRENFESRKPVKLALKDCLDFNGVERNNFESGNYYNIKIPLPSNTFLIKKDFNYDRLLIGNKAVVLCTLLPNNILKIISRGFECIMHINNIVIPVKVVNIFNDATKKQLKLIAPGNISIKNRFILQLNLDDKIIIERDSRCVFRLDENTIGIGIVKKHFIN